MYFITGTMNPRKMDLATAISIFARKSPVPTNCMATGSDNAKKFQVFLEYLHKHYGEFARDNWLNMCYASSEKVARKYWTVLVDTMQEKPKRFAKAMSLLVLETPIGCPMARQKFVTNVMIRRQLRNEARFDAMCDARPVSEYVQNAIDANEMYSDPAGSSCSGGSSSDENSMGSDGSSSDVDL
jgi:hypothetical protein